MPQLQLHLLMKSEEEIDAWYEEQKQKLLESYTSMLDKPAQADKVEQSFHKSMDSLMAQYTQQMNTFIAKDAVQKRKQKVQQAKKEKQKELFLKLKKTLPFGKKPKTEE